MFAGSKFVTKINNNFFIQRIAVVLFVVLSASAAPMNPAVRYRLAAKYSESMNGMAFLVMVDGKIVYEEYTNGGAKDSAHRIASGTKAFCGVMAAAAEQDGLLKLDEKACKTIKEWRDDPLKSKITIRQLLNITSGLDPGETPETPWFAVALARVAVHEPGTTFEYGPTGFQVFGEIMRRKLKGESAQEYVTRRVFNPIGMRVTSWPDGGDGNPKLAAGTFLTAREWSKFGEFLRLRGNWKGKQLVSKEALLQCFKGSRANPVYGLGIWLSSDSYSAIARFHPGERDPDRPVGPPDLVMSAGSGSQRLYIIPSMKMVCVRLGESDYYKDSALLLRLLYGRSK